MAELLVMKNIHKRFPGVYALRDINFDLKPGEVHALMGENGAGKSTLIKIMAGLYDFEGEYFVDGNKMKGQTPAQVIEKGVSIIYQELNLCLNMTVGENIYFNRWTGDSKFLINYAGLYRRTQKLLDDLGFGIRAGAEVGTLSTAQQQLVEIAKAISLDAKIIVMDEPTSALSLSEVQSLFQVVGNLKKLGIGIIYVSHKLDEIFAIADRVTVLRDGTWIGTKPLGELTESLLISMMVGREINDTYPKSDHKIGTTVLEVKELRNEKLKKVSFYVRAGEIIGFSGLMGAGRTELAKAVFGFDARAEGRVLVDGKELKANATWEAVKAGIGYVPEDRKQEGIFNYLSVAKNITISSEDELAKNWFIDPGRQAEIVGGAIEDLRVKTPTQEQFVEKLSGGNQQKVILGRWFIKKGIRILIVDEPTRGIDIGAKKEIYMLLDEFARKGMAIIIMSSEMPEIIGMCDRIYIMAEGKIKGELSRAEATQEEIMKLSVS